MPNKQGHVGTKDQPALPNISPHDLLAFHEDHFSRDALANFGTTFLDPPLHQQQDSHSINDEVWDEEDDLGYYDDGVKRTLTDEQIEIFRHSELEALRRDREKAQKAKAAASSSDEAMDISDSSPAPTQFGIAPAATASSHSGKKKKRKGAKRGRPEPKPDLRKRTWDVVDKGLDSLEYD